MALEVSRDEVDVVESMGVWESAFYSEAARELDVEIPSGGKKPEDGDVVGRLVRSLYGARDAPMNWELTIAEFMKKLGFLQGKSNPCITTIQQENVEPKCIEMISRQ